MAISDELLGTDPQFRHQFTGQLTRVLPGAGLLQPPLQAFLLRPRTRLGARIVKRSLDVLLASALLLVSLPVLLTCAVAVAVDAPGPIFFRQNRMGRGGREFRIWKLRTMVRDAEEQAPDLSGRNEAEGLLFKIRSDPRVTRVGAFLRRTSLDELPQLFNVLVGDMSLVGPRPPLPSEVEQYDERLRRRLEVKPGITGLWQVNGRHELPFEAYVEYDLKYAELWSIMLDLYILVRTIPAVFGGRGAF